MPGPCARRPAGRLTICGKLPRWGDVLAPDNLWITAVFGRGRWKIAPPGKIAPSESAQNSVTSTNRKPYHICYIRSYIAYGKGKQQLSTGHGAIFRGWGDFPSPPPETPPERPVDNPARGRCATHLTITDPGIR